ncbi:energy-coupling factor ABC transporter ATP-binding protein [Lactiplantibacillus mudanjiangensis]|uniref:Energy-coupling factor transporter ATP-binding protein EcfA2 n=1 Tax=Lactiplantibacillus mudanjiangensis TaxID=1296538 RepID=A0A660E1L0_9LACO|nr:energy-coupling factor ABC transporter ATP-binding protein [Lactiplantibacillus mudanjiangensis]VDG17663.1 energy-coupling factor ABC transporter ATP-binding protein [Lactobacillus sp.] [Lactiplantibacillus mudanjiangensis]VDG23060.1 energy-coupling factor ABC transporter ATP-binding protein [Lactobacillus sp.] [Lactiplantibacillus mudanjiangensis]VDG29534.1 energy-coupling factor ABC transporter ATP-binding protein [Lactobacillus sp.] [Lactiplantibacillus mudanjiangensis]VDG32647.1 energy-c
MAIDFKQVGFTYQPGTPFATQALTDINVTIPDGSYTALIGHTGSGKSTLLQHLNALLKPTTGTVTIGDRVITPETSNKDLKALRQHVGIVFQFPESQLFEETVAKDIAFGPQNFGASEADALKTAADMLALVGLDAELLDRSPFDLSGGQMRRVAIAGVLAMAPQVLVLDEPTAGLDPQGRLEMMEMFAKLRHERELTVVLVTHQMDDVANYADHVIVMDQGKIAKTGTPQEIFQDPQWLAEHHLGLPKTTAFAQQLMAKGIQFDQLPLTEDQLAQALAHQLGGATQ